MYLLSIFCNDNDDDDGIFTIKETRTEPCKVKNRTEGKVIIIGVRKYWENLIWSGGGGGGGCIKFGKYSVFVFYPWNINTEGEI